MLAQLRQPAGVPDLRLRVKTDQKIALIDMAMLLNNDVAKAARRVLDAFPSIKSK